MPRDYSNLLAAVRDETVESLRKNYENAVQAAAEHRRNAKDWQAAADRENHFADRDEERARQWRVQLDFAESEADSTTEAFVDVADAEDARLTEVDGTEHFDAAEAAAVRRIEHDMAVEAGDDSEIDQQVAEDDARNERRYEAHEANEAWLDAHPDDFVNGADDELPNEMVFDIADGYERLTENGAQD